MLQFYRPYQQASTRQLLAAPPPDVILNTQKSFFFTQVKACLSFAQLSDLSDVKQSITPALGMLASSMSKNYAFFYLLLMLLLFL